MVAGPDPVECVARAVRDALSPLECGFLHASKVFEAQWVSTVGGCQKGKNFEGFRGLNGKRENMDGFLGDFVVGESRKSSVDGERRKGPVRSFIGSLLPNSVNVNGNDPRKRLSLRKADLSEEKDEFPSCSNCLQFNIAWSVLANRFVQAFPRPLKSVKKCFTNQCKEDDSVTVKVCRLPVMEVSCVPECCDGRPRKLASSDGGILSLELVLCAALDSLIHNLHVLNLVGDTGFKSSDKLSDSEVSVPNKIDHWKIVRNLINGKKADFDSFLWNMRFARVGGAPASLVGATAAPANDGGEKRGVGSNRIETEINRSLNITTGLLNISLSNVERLKSTLSTVSLTDLIEFMPQLGRSSTEHPDKKKLFSVQDFFRYTEAEGRRFFNELDRDGDGQINLEDLEIAMRKRKLPRRYAKEFLHRTRSNIFSKSIGWKQFLSLMEQKEPTILRAYTTLCLSKSGTIQKSQILTSLSSAGLPASDDNATAMMRYLNAGSDASISYSHFRNFMLLLPSERLEEDPRSIWFEAATVVAVPPPVEISTGNVLKSALAGGLASALSTSLLHPIDTLKTRLQASSLSLPELVSKLPQIGIQGLYRGSIPAILGQFSSHGVRTGIFEASKLVLVNVAPTLPEIQVQSLASFCSTILGTAVRIPCEVLKQRLQAGIFDNVGEAIVGTLQQDGFKGFFRGTGATLCREVPFYVAGMCLYAEAKKAAQNLLNRDLEPWETIAVGALSGGLAAVVTTPFDVMKTRTMTAPQGLPVSMQMIAFSILQKEGPIGFFKGAVPRFFWIAPLGAMNFAGYELAKKAMVKDEQMAT